MPFRRQGPNLPPPARARGEAWPITEPRRSSSLLADAVLAEELRSVDAFLGDANEAFAREVRAGLADLGDADAGRHAHGLSSGPDADAQSFDLHTEPLGRPRRRRDRLAHEKGELVAAVPTEQ